MKLPKLRHWILEGRTPVAVDMMTWAKWFGDMNNRHIAYAHVGGLSISTVFLGIDHGFMEREPILFETMVFGAGETLEMDRYATYEEAEAGHRKMVAKYRKQQALLTEMVEATPDKEDPASDP